MPRTARRADHRAVVRSPRRTRSSAAARSASTTIVAKFDRQGLIAALKEQTVDFGRGGVRTIMSNDDSASEHRRSNTSP